MAKDTVLKKLREIFLDLVLKEVENNSVKIEDYVAVFHVRWLPGIVCDLVLNATELEGYRPSRNDGHWLHNLELKAHFAVGEDEVRLMRRADWQAFEQEHSKTRAYPGTRSSFGPFSKP